MQYVFPLLLCIFLVHFRCYAETEWKNCGADCSYCLYSFIRTREYNSVFNISESCYTIEPGEAEFTFRRIIDVIFATPITGNEATFQFSFICPNTENCTSNKVYKEHIACLQGTSASFNFFKNYGGYKPITSEYGDCECTNTSYERLDYMQPDDCKVYASDENSYCGMRGTVEDNPTEGHIYAYCYYDTDDIAGCTGSTNPAAGIYKYIETLTNYGDRVRVQKNDTIHSKQSFTKNYPYTIAYEANCRILEDYAFLETTTSRSTLRTSSATTQPSSSYWEVLGPVGAVLTIFLTFVALVFVAVNLRKIYEEEKRSKERYKMMAGNEPKKVAEMESSIALIPQKSTGSGTGTSSKKTSDKILFISTESSVTTASPPKETVKKKPTTGKSERPTKK